MSKIKDVVGEVYNRFVITEMLPNKKYGKHSYKFVRAKCICGSERDVCYKDLVKGRRKSCGCLSEDIKIQVKSGDKYTNWTIIKEGDGYFTKDGDKSDRTFLCKCVCGKEKEVNLNSLRQGQSKSCGCNGIPKKVKVYIIPEDTVEEQWRESITFPTFYISTLGRVFSYSTQNYIKGRDNSLEVGNKQTHLIKEMYKTFIEDYDDTVYIVYSKSGKKELKELYIQEMKSERAKKLLVKLGAIKTRCLNKNSFDYKNYGGRGITICDEWKTNSKAFVKWGIEQGYGEDLTLEIDREDNNGNYEPSNCRFVTKLENIRNSRTTKLTVENVHRMRYGDLKDTPAYKLANMFDVGFDTIIIMLKGETFKDVVE